LAPTQSEPPFLVAQLVVLAPSSRSGSCQFANFVRWRRREGCGP
jgi:hypothetical protein